MKKLTITFLNEEVTTPEEMAIYLNSVRDLLETGHCGSWGRIDFEYETDLYAQ
jgi:hypothetical protein